MREIKFRAWDKQFKMMAPPINIFFNGEEFFFFKGIGTRSVCHFQLEIMQYTGLKDKNDKEIYEGDIVLTNEAGWSGAITWNNNYCGFIIQDKHGGFSIEPQWGECEVIGNIYENPELLKE